MKRLLAVVLALAMLLLCACSGTPAPAESGSDAPAKGSPAASGDGEQTIQFLHQWSDEKRGPYFQGIVDGYMAQNPDVNIEVEAVANAPYKEKLRVMLGSNDVPDVFFTWDGDWLSKYARAGALLDISGYLQADSAWRDSFTPIFLQAGQVGDKQYGLPIRVCSDLVCYNKDIFAQYNLEVPKTWDDFERVCDTLLQNGIIPYAAGNAEGNDISHIVALTNIQLVPENIFNDDYTLVTGAFDDPGYVKGIELLVSFKEKGYFNEGFASTSQDLAREMFAAGQSAMVRENCANIKANILEKMDPEKLGVFAFPKFADAPGASDVVVAWIDQFVVSSRTDVADASVDFLKYFYKEENQQEMTRTCGFISPIASVNSNAELSYDQLNEAIEIINGAGSLTSTLDLELDAAVADVYLTGLQEIFTESSERTPADIMAQVHAEAQRVIAESK